MGDDIKDMVIELPAAGNRALFSLRLLLRSKHLTNANKLKLYTVFIFLLVDGDDGSSVLKRTWQLLIVYPI